MNKRAVAAIKRYRTRRLAKLIAKSAYLYRKKEYDRMANLICDEFVSLGGVYVKFLQGVLLRSEIMKRWHNPDRLKVFENLESEPLDIAKFLQNELPKDKLATIAMVQPQPFAAGSFGQVYFAQLRDGRQVIIKILRPMIRELLGHDLRLLGAFYKRFFVRMYRNIDIDLDQAVEEFKQATLNETNYRHEADFAHELYEEYKGHPQIQVPETIMDLCTDDMIVQEYVDGISVAALVKLKEQGVDPVRYVKDTIGSDLDTQLLIIGYQSIMDIFTKPRIMGDPHPGNIRLLPNNRVGLIDFGISAKTPEDKAAFFGILEAYDNINKNSIELSGMFEKVLHFFVGDLYQALDRLGRHVGAKTLNDVSGVASDLFEETIGTKFIIDDPNDTAILMTINKAMNKGNRFGLIMKLENSEILRATQTFTALVSALGRSKHVVPPMLDKVVRDVREQYPQYTIIKKGEISISSAVETVAEWLERVAARDPALFRKLTEKMRAVDTLTEAGEPNA